MSTPVLDLIIRSPPPVWVPRADGAPAELVMNFTDGLRWQNRAVAASSTSPLTITRALAGYAQDLSGNWLSFASGAFRRTNKGLLIEDARTNLFLNSNAPATQTITVTNATQYTVSLVGSGSIVLTGAGTGTVTEGSPVTFTSSTTSLTATVSGAGGTLNVMQCEAGPCATSPIVTVGSSVARPADVVQLIYPYASAFGIVADVAPIPSVTATRYVAGESATNRLLYASGSNTGVSTYNGSVVLGANLAGTWTGTGAKVSYGRDASGRTIAAGGLNGAQSDTNVQAVPTTIYLGSLNGSSALNTYIRSFAVFGFRPSPAGLRGVV